MVRLNSKVLFFLLYLVPFTNLAQENNVGSWNIFNVKYNVDNKWSLFYENQLRSLKFYDDFHYYEFKGGVNFKPSKVFVFTLGLGSYQTFKEGGNFVLPKRNDEIRVWPQLIVNQDLGGFKLEHRYRIEQRYTIDGVKRRFRYRLGLSYPFGKESNGIKPFQVSINNELFFTDKEPYFERNRLTTGFSYRPSRNIGFQIGFVNQFDYKINDETGKDFLQVGLYYEFFRKEQAQK